MQDFNGATIVRVVEKNKRVGAVVYRCDGLPPLILRENEIVKFDRYLKRMGQRLDNAIITANGHVVPIAGKCVESINKSVCGNAFDAPKKAKPDTQAAPVSVTLKQPTPRAVALPVQQNEGQDLNSGNTDNIVRIVLFLGVFVVALMFCVYFISWFFK